MEPLSRDTPLEVERLWMEGLRAKGPGWSFLRTVELSGACLQAAREGWDRAHPGRTRHEREMWLLGERYGEDFACRVEAWMKERGIEWS